ncbi:hypothetical protein [Rhodococcus sp. YH1]|uniref:hypothetical protein n=1 Tax=Rhodococcus sp. YH1 TaxID=89066 RepID=UPI0019D97772|nr:hypothetical protein [Rhodococcus sp. YH1]NCL78682.1 hypothetical protein [Rhodococcus sp. YH1]
MTGVFQLVFCDRGTPKAGAGPKARNLYTELRDALVTRGMQPDEIAFMHDYEGPKAKARLVEACADGRIRVLLTSTKKGGTGLNVQRALKQMINLDPAWTAADMELNRPGFDAHLLSWEGEPYAECLSSRGTGEGRAPGPRAPW